MQDFQIWTADENGQPQMIAQLRATNFVEACSIALGNQLDRNEDGGLKLEKGFPLVDGKRTYMSAEDVPVTEAAPAETNLGRPEHIEDDPTKSGGTAGEGPLSTTQRVINEVKESGGSIGNSLPAGPVINQNVGAMVAGENEKFTEAEIAKAGSGASGEADDNSDSLKAGSSSIENGTDAQHQDAQANVQSGTATPPAESLTNS